MARRPRRQIELGVGHIDNRLIAMELEAEEGGKVPVAIEHRTTRGGGGGRRRVLSRLKFNIG